MTVKKLIELFEHYCDTNKTMEFEEMEHPIKKAFRRRDLCAFVKLNQIISGDTDIISCAEHDQIWLEVELEELAKKITEEDIYFLTACGVFINEESLSMFV
jgi:hypothetical protein